MFGLEREKNNNVMNADYESGIFQSKQLPDGITTLAPSAGTLKLFSAEDSQNESLDQRLTKKTYGIIRYDRKN